MLSSVEIHYDYNHIIKKFSNYRKRFNNRTGSSFGKLHHKDKWFSYLRCILNRLTLLESIKEINIDLKQYLDGVTVSLLQRQQST